MRKKQACIQGLGGLLSVSHQLRLRTPRIVGSCLSQGCQFRTVPTGTAGIYRTGQQSSTFDPPVQYWKKYRPRTGRTGQFRAIPAGTEKSFFFFLSFVIFEFLLGQNGNLFVLTYQYYLFSQYAMVTFKLSILFFYFFSHLIDTKV